MNHGNFKELRDDLVERVGEDRLEQARREADDEVERYQRTLRELREAAKGPSRGTRGRTD